MEIMKTGRKPINLDAFARINDMKKGQQIFIDRTEWKLKQRPGAFLLREKLGREFKVNSVVDEKDVWMITAK